MHAVLRTSDWPRWLAWLSLLAVAAWVHAAQAAVPNEKAVPAYAEEQTILQLEQGQPEPGLGSAQSGVQHFDRHYIVPPGRMPEQDVILQRGGNTWRVLRNGPIATTAAVLMLGVLLAIAIFYGTVGPVPAREPETGRRIVRFTNWQRWVHWATAIAFVVLGLTGLILMFGKRIILPWLGHDAYGWLAIISKWLHNIAGPLFVLLSLLMFVTYLRHNHFRREDWTWLRSLGGMVSKRHVPADYFNAGEKLWFWVFVAAMGLLMAVTGLMMNFPYFGKVGSATGLTRYLLQWADYLHIAGATLYIGASLGHIYLGTLGTPGAWTAMRRGTVDESWARHHHSIWYDKLRSGSGGEPGGQRLAYGARPRPPRLP